MLFRNEKKRKKVFPKGNLNRRRACDLDYAVLLCRHESLKTHYLKINIILHCCEIIFSLNLQSFSVSSSENFSKKKNVAGKSFESLKFSMNRSLKSMKFCWNYQTI